MRMKRLKQKLEAEREKVSSYLSEIFPVCHRKQRHGIKAAVSGAVSDCLSLTHSTKTDLFRFSPVFTFQWWRSGGPEVGRRMKGSTVLLR